MGLGSCDGAYDCNGLRTVLGMILGCGILLISLGCIVGSLAFPPEGDLTGCFDGIEVNLSVGLRVGVSVGLDDSCFDGDFVGFMV
jgi:hypothetical protein